jgi:hypothetical protein
VIRNVIPLGTNRGDCILGPARAAKEITDEQRSSVCLSKLGAWSCNSQVDRRLFRLAAVPELRCTTPRGPSGGGVELEALPGNSPEGTKISRAIKLKARFPQNSPTESFGRSWDVREASDRVQSGAPFGIFRQAGGG